MAINNKPESGSIKIGERTTETQDGGLEQHVPLPADRKTEQCPTQFRRFIKMNECNVAAAESLNRPIERTGVIGNGKSSFLKLTLKFCGASAGRGSGAESPVYG